MKIFQLRFYTKVATDFQFLRFLCWQIVQSNTQNNDLFVDAVRACSSGHSPGKLGSDFFAVRVSPGELRVLLFLGTE